MLSKADRELDRGRVRGDPQALSLRLAGGRRGDPHCARQGLHRGQPRRLSRPHGGLRRGGGARPGDHRCGETGIDTIVAVRHPPPDEQDRPIAVVSPCGACRELIWDYDRNARVIVPGPDGPQVVGIGELLPNKYSRERGN